MSPRFPRPLLAAATLLTAASLCSCQTLKKLTPSVPKLSSVTNMIPGLGDGLPADDPTVPFNANGALGYGHSIALDIYEGVRSPKRLFEGKRMVDENGVISFGKTGSAKVGGRSLIDANRMISPIPVVNTLVCLNNGRSLIDANRMISSVFRVGGRSSFALTVHIPSVEGVDLVFIDGDVVNAAYIPMWDRMHLRDLIKIAGGRHPGSTARSLYITRAGQKMFFPNVEAAENWWRFKPGDIVTLSPDL